MADPFIIETIELRKAYDEVEALRGVDLQVPSGSNSCRDGSAICCI